MRLRVLPYPPSDPEATKRATKFLRLVQTGEADSYLRYPTAFWGESTDDAQWEGKRAFDVVFLARGESVPGVLSRYRDGAFAIIVVPKKTDLPPVELPRRVYLLHDGAGVEMAQRIQRIYDGEHGHRACEQPGYPRTTAQESNGWRRAGGGEVGKAAMATPIPDSAMPYATLRERLSHGRLVHLTKVLEHPYARHLQGYHERAPATRVALHVSVFAQDGTSGVFNDTHYLISRGEVGLHGQLTKLHETIETTWARVGRLRIVRVGFIEYEDLKDPLHYLIHDFDLFRPDRATRSPSLLWYCDCPTEDDFGSLERQMDTARVTGRGTVMDAFMRLQVARRVLLELDSVSVPIGFVPFKLIGEIWSGQGYTIRLDESGGMTARSKDGLVSRLTWRLLWDLLKQTRRIGVAGVFEEDLGRLAVQWSPFWEYDGLQELNLEQWCREESNEREEHDLADDDTSLVQYEVKGILEKLDPVSLPLNTLLVTQPDELAWLEQADVREIMDFVDPRWPADPAVTARTLRYPDGSRRLALFSTRRGGGGMVTFEREVDVVTSLAAGVDLIKRPIASQYDWTLAFQQEISIEQLSLAPHERDLGIVEDDYMTLIIQLGYLLRVDRLSTRVALYRTWLEPDSDEVRQLSHAALSWLRTGSEYSYFATRYGFAYPDVTRRHRAIWTIAAESPASVAPLHIAPDLPLEYLALSQQRWVVDTFTWLTKLKHEQEGEKGQNSQSVLQSMERALRIVGDDRMPRGAEGTLLHVLESLRDVQEAFGVLDVQGMRTAVERITVDGGRKRTGHAGTPKASQSTQKRRKYQ